MINKNFTDNYKFPLKERLKKCSKEEPRKKVNKNKKGKIINPKNNNFTILKLLKLKNIKLNKRNKKIESTNKNQIFFIICF